MIQTKNRPECIYHMRRIHLQRRPIYQVHQRSRDIAPTLPASCYYWKSYTAAAWVSVQSRFFSKFSTYTVGSRNSTTSISSVIAPESALCVSLAMAVTVGCVGLAHL